VYNELSTKSFKSRLKKMQCDKTMRLLANIFHVCMSRNVIKQCSCLPKFSMHVLDVLQYDKTMQLSAYIFHA